MLELQKVCNLPTVPSKKILVRSIWRGRREKQQQYCQILWWYLFSQFI